VGIISYTAKYALREPPLVLREPLPSPAQEHIEHCVLAPCPSAPSLRKLAASRPNVFLELSTYTVWTTNIAQNWIFLTKSSYEAYPNATYRTMDSKSPLFYLLVSVKAVVLVRRGIIYKKLDCPRPAHPPDVPFFLSTSAKSINIVEIF